MNYNSRISTDEDPTLRIESSAIINLRGVSTKLNKYIRNSITNYRFWGFFDGLTLLQIPFHWTFLKIDHYCGGFECKMRRVGQILTKLSIAENFRDRRKFLFPICFSPSFSRCFFLHLYITICVQKLH